MPQDPSQHDALGGELISQGRFQEAEACYRLVVEARPEFAEAHANLAFTLYKQGKVPEAIERYRRALALDPAEPVAHCSLGTLLKQQGQLEEAISHFREALVRRPDYLAALNNLGNCLRRTGRTGEAREVFQKVLTHRPDLLEAHYNLAQLKTYQEDDPQISQLVGMESGIASMTELSKIRYWFTRGKMMEDTGRFEDAFSAYAEGNRLMKAQVVWDEAWMVDVQSRMTALFTKTFFEERPAGRATEGPIPIFIVGMPRSGTSLIEQILATHPGVHGAGELSLFSEVLASASAGLPSSRYRFPESLGSLSAEDFRRLGDQYLARIRELAPGATHITDKMPSNFTYAGLIHLMLPGAKIIHSRRDPMDSCLSCFARHFQESNLAYTYDLGTLGRYWVRYHELMRHWRSVLPPGRILDISYEAMVADAEGEARKLLAYLELPWDPACLAFHENDRPVRTASAAQVRRPIYKTSVARWKRFEPHLGPLMELVKDYR